jgi:hypothetical protein
MAVVQNPKKRLRLVDYKLPRFPAPVVQRKNDVDLIASTPLQTWSPGEDMRM